MKLVPKLLVFSVAAISLVIILSAAVPRTVRATIIPPSMRKAAASFELEDATGNKVSLSHYRGKVVLLDFWATACGGCVREMPFFMNLAQTYNGRDLAVVGVSVDILYEDLKNFVEGWSKVRPFIQSHNVNYPILMADDVTTKAYNIQALPLTYLIDRQGKIAATYNGVVDATNVEANIKTLLTDGK